AGYAELPGGEALRPRPGDHHAPRRHAPPVLDHLGPGDVEDRGARGEHHPGADHRLALDQHALDHDHARPDEHAVFEDDRARPRRLQHAADPDPAGEVAVPPDL